MSNEGNLLFFQVLWDALPEPFKAAILATGIAILRVMYDGKEPKFLRRALEASLCGAIAFGLASGLEAINVPSGAATFVGASIGLLGADEVRKFAQLYVANKIERNKGGEK